MIKWIIILAAFSLPAQAETVLDGPAIEKAFKGVTVEGEYVDGLFFTETYQLDGKIKYLDKRNGALDGVWSVVKDKFCTFYWGMMGGCFTIQLKGTNCYEIFVDDSLTRSPNDANMQRYIAQDWRIDEPKTCGDLAV